MLLHAMISILLSAPPILASSQCFYPDGELSESLVPCDSSAEESHCCRASNLCLTNGLCFSSGLGSIVRRGCTDRDWNTSACGGPFTAGKNDESNYDLPPGKNASNKFSQVDGGGDFVKWMSSSDDFAVFRGFEQLNVQVLSFMQNQLTQKEEELATIGTEPWSAHRKTHGLDQIGLAEETREMREKLLNEIATLLHQYNEYLATYTQVEALRPAQKYHVDNIATWFQTHPNTKLNRHWRSLLNTNDLIAPFSKPRSPLHNFLGYLQARLLDRTPQPQEKEDNILYVPSHTPFDTLISLSNTLLVLLGIAFLVGPMWILHFLQDETKRLAIITAFIVLCAMLIGVATTAHPLEMLVVTAGYATVLMTLGTPGRGTVTVGYAVKKLESTTLKFWYQRAK